MHAWKDIVNAVFEMAGFAFVGLNCLDIWRKKTVAGQTLTAILFFASWGAWNLYFYPSLGQWWSTAGAVGVMFANLVMIALILRYRGAVVAVAVDEIYTGSGTLKKKSYPIKRKIVPFGKKTAAAFDEMVEAVRAASAPFIYGGIGVPIDYVYAMPAASGEIDKILSNERLSEGRTEIHHRVVMKDGAMAHEMSWEDKPVAKKKGKK